MACRPSRQSVISHILPLAVVVGLAAGTLGVCPAQAMVPRLANPDVPPGPTAVMASTDQDPGETANPTDPTWEHILQVIADLKASPPAEPVVCLLGGSASRECTVSDKVWAAQVKALGTTALTYNMGSRNRTLAENVALMEALPKNQLNMIVFIGVNVNRFVASGTRPVSITLPAPVFPLPPFTPHRYSQDRILSVADKRDEVSYWAASRYPIFQANYDTCRMMLERLIVVCKARGLHPVLVEEPRDMAIIGHALDAPISCYRSICRTLSVKYSIPFLSGFVEAANLTNGDFYDIWHIVQSGRVKWQRLLSEKTAELLQLYGLGLARSVVVR